MLAFINEENTAIFLFFIGIYGLATRRNIIKSVMSLGIIQAAIIMFFLSINSTQVPPIGASFSQVTSDPLPQALMVTAVVIGMSITGVSLIIFISIHNNYKSSNWHQIKRAKEQRDD